MCSKTVFWVFGPIFFLNQELSLEVIRLDYRLQNKSTLDKFVKRREEILKILKTKKLL